MLSFLPTIILRHRKENLKKCSLRGLENRDDMQFFTYPKDSLPPLSNYILLDMNAPLLSEKDKTFGIFLIDGTWNYAKKMTNSIKEPLIKRSLPNHFKTAYPRRQDSCDDPERGLASIEALFIAYSLLERTSDGLLDHYHWKDTFLKMNFHSEALS
ncbi:MAG: DTW domain-containing protein [Chlamydiae bacterium]|jgi:pre-rRNA-processing protein TSR3|nr:DTW domain-containing protein [Chlamydiota bacterium]